MIKVAAVLSDASFTTKKQTCNINVNKMYILAASRLGRRGGLVNHCPDRLALLRQGTSNHDTNYLKSF